MEMPKTKRSFKKELKRQIRYAITAAIGFIIAYAWRETILSYFEMFSLKVLEKESLFLPLTFSLITTIFCVILILITSKILQD